MFSAVLCLLSVVHGRPYFQVQPGQDRCFVEVVPPGQIMTVSYTHEEDPGEGWGVLMSLKLTKLKLSRMHNRQE